MLNFESQKEKLTKNKPKLCLKCNTSIQLKNVKNKFGQKNIASSK